MEEYRFRLFIMGQTMRSQQAIANIQAICDENLAGVQCSLSIIDVLDEPQLAEERKIIATPTLIKEYPYPKARIIGDLTNKEQIIQILGLESTQHSRREVGGKE